MLMCSQDSPQGNSQHNSGEAVWGGDKPVKILLGEWRSPCRGSGQQEKPTSAGFLVAHAGKSFGKSYCNLTLTVFKIQWYKTKIPLMQVRL